MTLTLNTATADATKSLSKITETATSTIADMAKKAAEVQKAISELRVPDLKPVTPPTDVENQPATTGENGEKP